jgi:hypothetical protein
VRRRKAGAFAFFRHAFFYIERGYFEEFPAGTRALPFTKFISPKFLRLPEFDSVP